MTPNRKKVKITRNMALRVKKREVGKPSVKRLIEKGKKGAGGEREEREPWEADGEALEEASL